MSEQVNVLLDLNIDGDCTNLGALSVLHVLANRGKARILATTACFNSPLATGCIKAINRYYGRGDLPVGILHRQNETHPTPFMKPVNEKFCPDHPNGEDAPDSVTVMRRALAGEPDGSVTFVVVGCFASAAALLESGPDEISPLTGQELCDRKIRRLVAMAGEFPTFNETFGENNIVVQIPAARYVTEHFKGELVLSGYEVGIRARSLREFRLHGPDDHPLKMMYVINDGEGFTEGNPSWDHTAVIEGVLPGEFFDLHESGRIDVTEKEGITVWRPEEGGKQSYLIPRVPLDEVAAYINDLIFPEWRNYTEG